jgi:hypothetical protein
MILRERLGKFLEELSTSGTWDPEEMKSLLKNLSIITPKYQRQTSNNVPMEERTSIQSIP